MRVGVKGQADLAVPKNLRDHFCVDIHREQQTGSTMSEIVESDHR